jgi:hypothetical protein
MIHFLRIILSFHAFFYSWKFIPSRTFVFSPFLSFCVTIEWIGDFCRFPPRMREFLQKKQKWTLFGTAIATVLDLEAAQRRQE